MVYKKYQCRYFDSRGRPLNPACNQGSSCRFLHPEDDNWPGLKPLDKRTNIATSPNSNLDPFVPHYAASGGKSKLPNFNMSPRRSERHSTPLVSQNDLFMQRKAEEDEKTHDPNVQSQRVSIGKREDRDPSHSRGRESKRTRESHSRNSSINSSRPRDSRSYSSSKKQDHNKSTSSRSTKFGPHKSQTVSGTKIPDIEPVGPLRSDRFTFGSKDNSKPVYNNDFETFSAAHITPLIIPASAANLGALANDSMLSGGSHTKERVEQIATLFRDLSRLCSQATQDAEIQARDDKKLKAYTELSSTLSKVSNTAAAAVMPNLAEVLLRHAQGKQRADENLQNMSRVWEEVFDAFVTEVSCVLDTKLQDTVKKIRAEGEQVYRSIASNLARTSKRQRSSLLPSSPETGDHRDRSHDQAGDPFDERKEPSERRLVREQKRRRFEEPSLSPTPEFKHRVPQSTIELQSGIQDILNQMKSKIDEQAQSLQKLTKENNELKATLLQRTSIASCHSLSSTLASQPLRPGTVSSNVGAVTMSPVQGSWLHRT
ncbi:hypothetical protein Hypma_011584 [Hypsizygus marmoreus]|uniref:C3H1-type domain-containing protein n=1 Tax=Hypsizygus marmoreus TaxID=39966 RepID=A0A369JFW9_HYPMA|nr:hypothetical protein Hypma_011584 [Hypsizygus marmoreus]